MHNNDGAVFFDIPFRNIRTTFLCYLAAHGGILLIPNAIYWDDWTFWNTKSATILDLFVSQDRCSICSDIFTLPCSPSGHGHTGTDVFS